MTTVTKKPETAHTPPAENSQDLLSTVLDATQRKLAADLRNTASRYTAAIDQCVDHTEKSLVVATGINKLRAILTDQVMGMFVLPLVNSPVGFLTDRPNDKHPQPYPVEVIRDCAIAALLAGFRLVGNEFNVIAGRTMGVKAGWRRLVKDFPGHEDSDVVTGLPKVDGSCCQIRVAAWAKVKGAKIALTDSQGQPGRVFTFGARASDSLDAWAGKAERRAWMALYHRISGASIVPDDDEEEPTVATSKTEPETKPTRTDALADKIAGPAEKTTYKSVEEQMLEWDAGLEAAKK